MKLGLSSWAYAWNIGVPGHLPSAPLDGRGLIRCAAELGVGVVQIADNLPLEKQTSDEVDLIRDAARDARVAIEVGTRGIDPAHLRRMLGLCSRLGSPILRVVVDTATFHPSVDEVVRILEPLRNDFNAAGVTLALENHDRFSAGTFAEIIERLGPDWTGICLDTVNSFGALEGPAVVIATLAPYTVNLHLKDFVVRRHPSMMGFEITGAPAGQGRLDVPALLSALRGHSRNANAIIELWPSPEGDIEATVAKEREWAAQSVRFLRTLIPE